MLRFPSKLRRDACVDFIGSTTATRILRTPALKTCPRNADSQCITADDIDAAGISVVTGVLDESIWPYLYANAAERLHGGPSAFLATLFDGLAPLNLPPPPPPSKRKKWVPGRFLDGSNRKWLGKLLLRAGAILAAGVVIAAIIILAEPLMKLFSFIGNLLLMAGGFLGSVIMAIAQCMADHGLMCPIHGIMMMLKGALNLAMSIGGWVIKGIGKFFGKILFGAMMLGKFALGAFGKMFEGLWYGIGKVGLAIGKVFEKMWAGMLGLAGFVFGAIGKLFATGFGMFINLMKKINIGGIVLGLVLTIGKIGMSIGKIGLAVPKLFVAGMKHIGAAIQKMATAIPGLAMLIPNFIFSGITLGLASLGKLSINLKAPNFDLVKQFFIKGLPKFFEWMLIGPFSVMLSVGVSLGGLFDKLGDIHLDLPDFTMPGLPGIGELMLSIGGIFGHLILSVGDLFINAMSFGFDMAIAGLEAGWHFVGMILGMLGPAIVKFFEGVWWLAKMIYDTLGHLVLGAMALIAAGVKALVTGLGKLFSGIGKLSLKLVMGAFTLALSALKALPALPGKAFAAIGSLFKNMAIGAFNLTVGIGEIIGNLLVKLGKFGFSAFGLAIKGLAFFIPWAWKTLGLGFKKFFELVFSGLALGFSFTLKGFDMYFNMWKTALNFLFTLPKLAFKLPDFSLAGLKALWGAIKLGGVALGKFAVGFWKSMMWVLKDPRRLLTALVLIAYVAFLCFGMGYCQHFNTSPGWGQVPPPETAGYQPARLGWKIRGGKRKFKFSWGWLGKQSKHKFMEIMVPTSGEEQVRNAEALANGKDLLSKPRTYKKMDRVKWDRKIGDFQAVETDKSGFIVATDIASNDYWNCGPPHQKPRTIFNGHPTMRLSEPVKGIRVQLFDVESGELNWDATYQLGKPGILDASAKEVTGKRSWATDGGIVPGFRGFNRLCIPPGDETDHEFELVVTRYPPYANTSASSDHLQEQNKLGTAHYKVWQVSDPRAPSEEAAKQDSQGLRSVGQSIGMAGTIIAIAPTTPVFDCRPQAANSPINQNLRLQRHRQFWVADSGPPKLSSRHLSARRNANFFSAPSSAGLVVQ